MHGPLTPSSFLLTKMLSLGDLAMISMERKAAKAISNSLYPLPDAIISPKVNKANRHKSRAHTKELTHIKTLYWPTHLQIWILAHLHNLTFA